LPPDLLGLVTRFSSDLQTVFLPLLLPAFCRLASLLALFFDEATRQFFFRIAFCSSSDSSDVTPSYHFFVSGRNQWRPFSFSTPRPLPFSVRPPTDALLFPPLPLFLHVSSLYRSTRVTFQIRPSLLLGRCLPSRRSSFFFPRPFVWFPFSLALLVVWDFFNSCFQTVLSVTFFYARFCHFPLYSTEEIHRCSPLFLDVKPNSRKNPGFLLFFRFMVGVELLCAPEQVALLPSGLVTLTIRVLLFFSPPERDQTRPSLFSKLRSRLLFSRVFFSSPPHPPTLLSGEKPFKAAPGRRPGTAQNCSFSA